VSQHGQEAVYEMLWDCKYCGQKKLLGVTHRFCANCGGPQDPAARYFPPDNEKVAVQNHQYVGADLHCPACNQPMSRAVKCCTNCGSPVDKGKEVALKAEQWVPPPGHAPPQGFHGQPPMHGQGPQVPLKQSNVGKIIMMVVGGFFAIIVLLILLVVFWKKEGVFAVTGHTWERSIAVEKFEATRKSVWCDDVPASAKVVSRRKEQKGTEKKPDGETCGTRKKDMGNGTFKEVKECTPKYKETPVYADKCDIDVTEWHVTRTAKAGGASIADAPRWPESKVTGGTCLGCEREGARTEKYLVLFADTAKSSEKAQCALPQGKWAAFPVGSKWKGKVSVMTGDVDCDALQKQ
jgi:hypothetical protein